MVVGFSEVGVKGEKVCRVSLAALLFISVVITMARVEEKVEKMRSCSIFPLWLLQSSVEMASSAREGSA